MKSLFLFLWRFFLLITVLEAASSRNNNNNNNNNKNQNKNKKSNNTGEEIKKKKIKKQQLLVENNMAEKHDGGAAPAKSRATTPHPTTASPLLVSPAFATAAAATAATKTQSNFVGTSNPEINKSSSSSSSTNNNNNNSTDFLHLHRDPIYMWSSLVAGAGSGALASILCAPLDLIRTRLQVWGDVMTTMADNNKGKQQRRFGAAGGLTNVPHMVRDIVRKEGVQGCFRGLGATLMTVPAFWGVYFPLYDDLKRHWKIHHPETNDSLIHMGSAVAAGIVSDVLCNPMFVVRTRLQTEALHALAAANNNNNNVNAKFKPRSVSQTAKALYREGGIWIFWRGMTANLLGLSHVAVQFPVYEALKKRLKHDRTTAAGAGAGGDGNNNALDLLAASALSKMTACLLTYPHEVIRSRMMDARTGVGGVGFIDTCRRIYAAEGAAGFYAGLPITLLRVLPNTCITFLTYELLLQWARRQIEHHRRIR